MRHQLKMLVLGLVTALFMGGSAIAMAAPPWATPWLTSDGVATTLPNGSVVVEAFHIWCVGAATTAHFGYDEQDAAISRRAGIPFVVADLSHRGGIGVAGTIPTKVGLHATGHDGPKGPIHSRQENLTILQQWLNTYHVTTPAYWDHSGKMVQRWDLQYKTNYVLLNAQHQVVAVAHGWHTPKAFAQWLRRVRPLLAPTLPSRK